MKNLAEGWMENRTFGGIFEKVFDDIAEVKYNSSGIPYMDLNLTSHEKESMKKRVIDSLTIKIRELQEILDHLKILRGSL